MSGFSASEAAAFLDASFPFLLGEFFNSDGVNVHGVWVNFGVLVAGVVSLSRVGVVGFSQSDGIHSVPLGFKVDSLGIPLVNRGGYSVHAIDSPHEGGGDPS